MMYLQAKRDLTIRYTEHFVPEGSIITLREYQRISGSLEDPASLSWRKIELPQYYVYFENGYRYPYCGALENYGEILEG